MDQADPRYWVDRPTWSWQATFLAFNALALLFALPASRPVAEAGDKGEIALLFPSVFVLLWTAFTVNFGQLQGHLQRPGRGRLGSHLLQLGARLSLLELVSLPLWVVFYFAFRLRPTGALALGYLWLYGQAWGWLGLWLSLKGFSEISQFKLKYLVLVATLASTLFVARPLSPFLTLQALLNPNGLAPHEAGFLALSLGGLLLLLLGLGAALWWGERARVS